MAEPTVAGNETRARLASKLAQVMGEIANVAKAGRNEFHRYDYATEADIVKAVREKLSEKNVILLTSVTGDKREANAKGDSFTTILSTSHTFLDGDTGEMFTCPFIGSGEDKGDKGPYKALTGSVKYFLLKTFLIPTGDDPEDDKPSKTDATNLKPPQAKAQATAPAAAAPTFKPPQAKGAGTKPPPLPVTK